LTLAFAGGGATRGVVVAIVSWIVMSPFAPLGVTHFWAILVYAVGASLMLSFIGILSGMWAEKFDHMATVSNFIIMPAALLSGTFYSVTMLPPLWEKVSHYNPVFYLIDGFRYGFIGQADSNLAIGVTMLIVVNLVLGFWCHALFRSNLCASAAFL
jgi:ABC-2 type transport system permease protein